MNTQKSVVNGIYRDVQAQKVNGRIQITNLNGHELASLEILSHNESEILEVLQIYRDDKSLKQSFWKGYGMSSTAIAEAYVKDSYRFGRDNLIEILTDNLIETGYTTEFLKKIETFSFENTSAVLYKNVYITPKMLEVVIRTAIDMIQDTDIIKLADKYSHENKASKVNQVLKKALINNFTNEIVKDIKENKDIVNTADMIHDISDCIIPA